MCNDIKCMYCFSLLYSNYFMVSTNIHIFIRSYVWNVVECCGKIFWPGRKEKGKQKRKNEVDTGRKDVHTTKKKDDGIAAVVVTLSTAAVGTKLDRKKRRYVRDKFAYVLRNLSTLVSNKSYFMIVPSFKLKLVASFASKWSRLSRSGLVCFSKQRIFQCGIERFRCLIIFSKLVSQHLIAKEFSSSLGIIANCSNSSPLHFRLLFLVNDFVLGTVIEEDVV